MKKQVNTKWFNQQLRWFERSKKEEIRLVKFQHERFFNGPNAFDLKNNIYKDQIKGYLFDAVKKLGKSEVNRSYFLARHEPNDSIKPDWRRIEAYIKRNSSKVNDCIDTKSKWDFYAVVSQFFCLAKWGIPECQANNERVFNLMYKYCEGY